MLLRKSERISDKAAGAALWRTISSQAGTGWRAPLSAVELYGGEREIICNIDLFFQWCGVNFTIKYRNKRETCIIREGCPQVLPKLFIPGAERSRAVRPAWI